ncbi:unnamed protein product [Medioppia subpectinata]|uniref:Cell division cycle protein 123 homolog n=1 Tax=Medioppia subpectinata TaxID=1979941 RepID=A0A7R9KDF4_9ACAR|nr:unnamed protein product [Medioppia subpectinata]CAG2101466.1 unnamed protein product [Medioppia subpectinata]
MLSKHVLNCGFSQWYSLFADISIDSKSMKLSDDFIQYLLSDGIVLPKSGSDGNDDEIIEDHDWGDDNDHQNGFPRLPDGGGDDSDGQSSGAEAAAPEFPEMDAFMRSALDSLGAVFPKLNWSSCEDSSWMSATGTRCLTPDDVYLLLKSSDRIVHDLTQPFKDCTDETPPVEHELVLKKWVDMNPSMEFRCFVANNQLIGITQRDVRSYYEHIGHQKEDIIGDIHRLFVTRIQNQFPDRDFVMDVYRPTRGRVVLVDMNPFGATTDSLLFDWEELYTRRLDIITTDDETPIVPEFRFLTSGAGVQPQRYSMNSLPIEALNGYSLDQFMDGFHIDR